MSALQPVERVRAARTGRRRRGRRRRRAGAGSRASSSSACRRRDPDRRDAARCRRGRASPSSCEDCSRAPLGTSQVVEQRRVEHRRRRGRSTASRSPIAVERARRAPQDLRRARRHRARRRARCPTWPELAHAGPGAGARRGRRARRSRSAAAARRPRSGWRRARAIGIVMSARSASSVAVVVEEAVGRLAAPVAAAAASPRTRSSASRPRRSRSGRKVRAGRR